MDDINYQMDSNQYEKCTFGCRRFVRKFFGKCRHHYPMEPPLAVPPQRTCNNNFNMPLPYKRFRIHRDPYRLHAMHYRDDNPFVRMRNGIRRFFDKP